MGGGFRSLWGWAVKKGAMVKGDSDRCKQAVNVISCDRDRRMSWKLCHPQHAGARGRKKFLRPVCSSEVMGPLSIAVGCLTKSHWLQYRLLKIWWLSAAEDKAIETQRSELSPQNTLNSLHSQPPQTSCARQPTGGQQKNYWSLLYLKQVSEVLSGLEAKYIGHRGLVRPFMCPTPMHLRPVALHSSFWLPNDPCYPVKHVHWVSLAVNPSCNWRESLKIWSSPKFLS